MVAEGQSTEKPLQARKINAVATQSYQRTKAKTGPVSNRRWQRTRVLNSEELSESYAFQASSDS